MRASGLDGAFGQGHVPGSGTEEMRCARAPGREDSTGAAVATHRERSHCAARSRCVPRLQGSGRVPAQSWWRRFDRALSSRTSRSTATHRRAGTSSSTDVFLLDTNVISETARKHPAPRVLAWIESSSPARLFISTISLAELVRGVHKHPDEARRDQLRSWLDRVLYQFEERIVPFGREAAEKTGFLLGSADRVGRPRSLADAQIAGIALHHRLTLVTRNARDFRDDVPVFDPWID
jgi:predicted nucleic acid-binding protein